jgi:hypothetical protein
MSSACTYDSATFGKNMLFLLFFLFIIFFMILILFFYIFHESIFFSIENKIGCFFFFCATIFITSKLYKLDLN